MNECHAGRAGRTDSRAPERGGSPIPGMPFADQLQLLTRGTTRPPGARTVRISSRRETSNPHHVELVEVWAKIARELGALQQRHRGVRGQRQHPLLKSAQLGSRLRYRSGGRVSSTGAAVGAGAQLRQGTWLVGLRFGTRFPPSVMPVIISSSVLRCGVLPPGMGRSEAQAQPAVHPLLD